MGVLTIHRCVHQRGPGKRSWDFQNTKIHDLSARVFLDRSRIPKNMKQSKTTCTDIKNTWKHTKNNENDVFQCTCMFSNVFSTFVDTFFMFHMYFHACLCIVMHFSICSCIFTHFWYFLLIWIRRLPGPGQYIQIRRFLRIRSIKLKHVNLVNNKINHSSIGLDKIYLHKNSNTLTRPVLKFTYIQLHMHWTNEILIWA